MDLEALCRDTSRGASEIAADAARLLDRIARQADAPHQAVMAAGCRLIEAHPAMAPLVTLVDEALDRLDASGPDGLASLAEARRQRTRQAAKITAQRLSGLDRVATYSRSGTVLQALAMLQAAGEAPAVLLSEARPGYEGVEVASTLAERGLEIQLTTDAALASQLDGCQVLAVGADALSRRGVVNKVGTGWLAREAQATGLEVLVAAATTKHVPASMEPGLQAEAPLEHELPPGVTEVSPLFELVGWEAIDQVANEHGLRSGQEACQTLEAKALDPELAQRLGLGGA